VQVEVTKTAQEAGIKFPMFLTRAVFDNYVAVPEGVTGQDEAGRLWDVVWMTRFGILRARPGVDRIPVAFYVRNDNRAARLVNIIATCGSGIVSILKSHFGLEIFQFGRIVVPCLNAQAKT
jgi:hypothetical protein